MENHTNISLEEGFEEEPLGNLDMLDIMYYMSDAYKFLDEIDPTLMGVSKKEHEAAKKKCYQSVLEAIRRFEM